MSFTFSFAGQFESTLVVTTPGARRVSDLRYATIEAAMMDLARVMHGDTKAIYADLEAREGAEGWFVYRDEADADADDTGAAAIAVIEEAPAPTKSDVGERGWETVSTFVATFPTEEGEGEATVEVQVGEAAEGAWFIRTRDDAGGSDDADDTAYPTRKAAEVAAADYAKSHDEVAS